MEVQVQRCRGAEVQGGAGAGAGGAQQVHGCKVAEVQRGEEEVQRRCRGAEEVKKCRGSEEVQRCRGAEVYTAAELPMRC
mgnify:CR=1 FL=1